MDELTYKSSLSELFKRFSMHYQNAWIKTGDDISARARHWLNELSNSEMKPADIIETIDKVTRDLKFQQYPPNASQFINCWVSAKKTEDDPFYSLANQAIEFIRSFYLKGDKALSEQTSMQWAEVFKEQAVESSVVMASVKGLCSSSHFATFSPTLSDICYESFRLMVDHKLPRIKDAYKDGYAGRLSGHPVMSEVRRQAGNFNLKSSKANIAIPLFETTYASVLKELATGERLLEKEQAETVKEEDKVTNASGVLQELLENW
jgi:hypothetical protein